MTVAQVRGWGHLTGHGGGACLFDEKAAVAIQDANAAFIVRACNSHQELIAALRRAVETIRAFHGIGINGLTTEQHIWKLYQESPEMRAINAAIAKAEGR